MNIGGRTAMDPIDKCIKYNNITNITYVHIVEGKSLQNLKHANTQTHGHTITALVIYSHIYVYLVHKT